MVLYKFCIIIITIIIIIIITTDIFATDTTVLVVSVSKLPVTLPILPLPVIYR